MDIFQSFKYVGEFTLISAKVVKGSSKNASCQYYAALMLCIRVACPFNPLRLSKGLCKLFFKKCYINKMTVLMIITSPSVCG